MFFYFYVYGAGFFYCFFTRGHMHIVADFSEKLFYPEGRILFQR